MSKNPYILIIDDDLEIISLLKAWLKNLPYDLVCCTDPKDFLLHIRNHKPALCIIDVNIGLAGVGFKLVESIRNVLGKYPPILLFSSEADKGAIAHGIEVGADDYIIKPSSRASMLEKVEMCTNSTYFTQKSIQTGIPDEYKSVKILIDVMLEYIDEFGIKIRCSELLVKGNVVLLKSDFFSQFSGNQNPILGCVVSNWIHPEDQSTGALIEFENVNESFNEKIRQWIVNQQETELQIGRPRGT